ncbi:MAG: alpha/beta fold hydrolase [Steroidobacteraceae bacterium]
MTAKEAQIERAFVNLREGQLHLRRLAPAAGAIASADIPILMLHASPTSSYFMQGLMRALRSAGLKSTMIAPDTLGNGDSAAPAADRPDIAYFADSMQRTLDALGIDRVDVYGAHTGARIACELSASCPARVRRVVLDGIIEYDDDMRQLVIDNYAPQVAPDDYGRQFIWAFNFVRDQALHFPWFMRDPAHRLAAAIPSAEVLHRATIDVLKAMDTYALPYIAAFEYRAYARMPMIQAPVLLLKPDSELPVLNAAIDKAAGLLRDSHVAAIGGGERAKATAITEFLLAAE